MYFHLCSLAHTTPWPLLQLLQRCFLLLECFCNILSYAQQKIHKVCHTRNQSENTLIPQKPSYIQPANSGGLASNLSPNLRQLIAVIKSGARASSILSEANYLNEGETLFRSVHMPPVYIHKEIIYGGQFSNLNIRVTQAKWDDFRDCLLFKSIQNSGN